MTPEDITELVVQWKASVAELDNMLYADTKKEFAPAAQIGFGLDGDEASRQDDFRQVRGTFDENSFVAEIRKHIAVKTALGDELIGRLKGLGESPK